MPKPGPAGWLWFVRQCGGGADLVRGMAGEGKGEEDGSTGGLICPRGLSLAGLRLGKHRRLLAKMGSPQSPVSIPARIAQCQTPANMESSWSPL